MGSKRYPFFMSKLGQYIASFLLEDFPINEYSEKIINQLVAKFTQENPELSDNQAKEYIKRFDQIKNNLPVDKRDITKYSWNNLEQTVAANQSKRIKAGKLNDGEPKDANLVYNKDGLRVYVGNTKQACIKYGNGYSFCISARGDDNLYADYRYEQGGTPYFVFDDTKSSERDEDGEFINPDHLVVVFVFENDQEPYSTTIADNSETDYWKSFDEMIRYFPRFKDLKNIFQPVEIDQKEYEEFELGEQYSILLYNLNSKYWDKYHKERGEENAINTYRYFDIETANKNIEDLLNNKIKIYKFTGIVKSNALDKYTVNSISQNVNIKAGDDIKDEGKKWIKNNIIPNVTYSDSEVTSEDFLNDWDIEFKDTTSASWHREYLQDIKKIVDEYRKDLAKLKLMKENLERKQRLTESETGTIQEFIKYACKNLEIQKVPRSLTLSYDTNQVKDRRSFGYFDPNNQKVWVYVKNRNMADILRTLAHELVHHKQNLDGRISYESGKTGSDIENEANAKAGVLLRDFGKQNDEIYQ